LERHIGRDAKRVAVEGRHAEAAIDKDAWANKTVLDHRDMDALVKRVDFPSK